MKRHCDRCEGITGEKNEKGLADGVVIFKLDSLRKDITFAELCSECLNSLVEWMKPITPEYIPDPEKKGEDEK